MTYESKNDLRTKIRRLGIDLDHEKRMREIADRYKDAGWVRAKENAATADAANKALIALAKATGIYDNYLTLECGHWEDDLSKPITQRKREASSLCGYGYYCTCCRYPRYKTVTVGYEQKYVEDGLGFNREQLISDLAAVADEKKAKKARKRLTPKTKKEN